LSALSARAAAAIGAGLSFFCCETLTAPSSDSSPSFGWGVCFLFAGDGVASVSVSGLFFALALSILFD
jgi:hypothetical protein